MYEAAPVHALLWGHQRQSPKLIQGLLPRQNLRPTRVARSTPPRTSFPSSEPPASVSDVEFLSHKFTPNLSPEILTIPEPLWISMSESLFCLTLRNLWQLHMASLVDRHLSLSTGVLKGSWAGGEVR